MMRPHTCEYSRSCCCNITALEPNEDCPIHGYPVRFNCVVCGKFMKRPIVVYEVNALKEAPMQTNTLPVRRYYAHMQYISSEAYQGDSEFVLFSDYEASEVERIQLKHLSDAQAERIAEIKSGIGVQQFRRLEAQLRDSQEREEQLKSKLKEIREMAYIQSAHDIIDSVFKGDG